MTSLRKLLRTSSNTSSNKENTAALDVASPKSLVSNSSSPKGETAEALLERKTKECETARKLIETMKIARSKDESTISELKITEQNLVARVDELEKQIASLKSQLEQSSNIGLEEIEKLKIELENTNTEKTACESRITALVAEMESVVAANASRMQERDSQVAQLRSEAANLAERVSNTTAELDNLRSRKGADESRLQAELKKANDALNKASEEKGTLQWQLDKEKEVSAKKVNELQSQITENQALVAKRDARISELEAELVAVKKSDDAAKQEAVRKLRIAEAKHLEAEETLEGLKKQLKEAQEAETAMREEVDLLIQQQSGAIDKVSLSNKQREIAESASKEAQEKLKQVTAKLSAVEKQLRTAEDQVQTLKKDISEKATAIANQETESTKRLEAEKHRTQNVAIITSVAVLIVSRLIFGA
jgi:chromosome segregation ATPase